MTWDHVDSKWPFVAYKWGLLTNRLLTGMILQAPWFVPGCYRPYINQKRSCGFDFCPGFLQVRMDRSTGLPKWTCNHHCNVDGHGVDFMAISSDRNRQLTEKTLLLGKPSKIIWSWIWWKQIPDRLYQTFLSKFETMFPKCWSHIMMTPTKNLQPKRFVSQVMFQPPPKTHQRNLAKTSMWLSCSQVSQALFNKDNEVGQMFCLQRFHKHFPVRNARGKLKKRPLEFSWSK